MVHAIRTLPRVPAAVPTRPSPRAPLSIRSLRAAFRWFGPLAPQTLARFAERLYFSPRRIGVSPREAQWLVGSDLVWVGEGASRVAAYVWPYGGMFPWEAPRQRGTVLLVHGWEGFGAQLGAFVDPLRSAGYRVIAFDAPAHGRSPGDKTTLFDFASAIRAVADRFGDIDAVVAHSMGVPSVALALSAGLTIRRAALIGGPARFDGATRRFARELALDERIEGLFRRNIEVQFGEDIWERLDTRALATEHAPPALVLHDVDDPIVHFSEAEHLVAAWPSARLLATAGLGHQRILQDPLVLEQVVDFIGGEELGPRIVT